MVIIRGGECEMWRMWLHGYSRARCSFDPRCTIVETRLTSDALTASGFFVAVDLFTLDFGLLVRYDL